MRVRAAIVAGPLGLALSLGSAAAMHGGPSQPGHSHRQEAVAEADLPAEERIRYYAVRLAESPRLYPLLTRLGLAYLDRARETHDPVWLPKAREAVTGALSVQENFESLLAMAAIENFAHRFAEAVRWGERAAAASVNGPAVRDPLVAAALVEARIGLGEIDEARRHVPASIGEAEDFDSAAALGLWLDASGRVDEAVSAFALAGDHALRQGVADRAAWAEAAAAGALLAAGRTKEAHSRVEAADRHHPGDPVVVLRRAEIEQAEGRHAEAHALLDALLRRGEKDPAIEMLAHAAARRAGDGEEAERHFAAAEQGLRRAIDAGEIYTLGSLAQLYADAGRSLERALALAEENLKWKRDREALATLAAVRALGH
jgi:tetratricopeptide (TPR) repeat protein